MQQISDFELSSAYLISAGLICLLLFLARRNRKQGWRKHRQSWFQAQSAGALRALESQPEHSRPFVHLGDLDRLRQALTEDGESACPAPAPVAQRLQQDAPTKDSMLA